MEEKDPQIKPPIFDYSLTQRQSDEQSVEALLKKLAEFISKNRLLLKPFFQDKDISKIGRVSFTRMRSILDNNKIPLSDAQYNILCQRFAYQSIEFNYLDFIESLKEFEAQYDPQSPTL